MELIILLVLFGTVIVALLPIGLAVFAIIVALGIAAVIVPASFFQSLAIGAILVVIIALAAILTLFCQLCSRCLARK